MHPIVKRWKQTNNKLQSSNRLELIFTHLPGKNWDKRMNKGGFHVSVKIELCLVRQSKQINEGGFHDDFRGFIGLGK